MGNEEIGTPVKQELLDAMTYFVDRQKIALQLLDDLGFDTNTKWVLRSDNSDHEMEPIRKWIAHNRTIPPKGIWVDRENNQWDYWIRGFGCKLTNLKTGEPIEWDAVCWNSFDPFVFFDNLFWQFHAIDRYDKVDTLKIWIGGDLRHLIDILVEEGQFNQDHSLPDKKNDHKK